MNAESGQPREGRVVDHEGGGVEGADHLKVLLAAAAAACGSTALAIHASGGGSGRLATVAASPLFFLGFTGAFAAATWAGHHVEMGSAGGSRRSFAVVLGCAVLLRLIALSAPPALSDDAYRYVWDGHVQRAGLNPYAHAPADPALDPWTTSYRGRINNPDLPTIYPPVTQLAFRAAALVPGEGLVAVRVVMILFDLGTIAVLGALLRRRGRDPAAVLIYAWSPLAVIEVGWSGHCDPVGVFFLAAALLAIDAGWKGTSLAAAALAGAAKYAGWLAIPSLARRARWRDGLVAPLACAAVYAPYLGAGMGVLGSLPAYAERWRFNDSLFAIALQAVERLRVADAVRGGLRLAGCLDPSATWESSLALRLTEPLSIAKILAAAAFAAFALRILRRRWDDPCREILALLGGALLLSPTLHPWYLLWIAPFLPIVPRRSWLWLTFAAPLLSYPMMAARAGDADPLAWLAAVEYVPFFALLAIESARRRLWERA
ncbi:MAG: hypothetical protein HY049_11510 [Acidobacteria bacterium]|nr:hypothetical protein [Acidobacteriota bacterium]